MILVSAAKSQDPPPPPAPLIFSSPAASELHSFNSGGDGFEALFSGYPKKTTKLANGVYTEIFTAKNKAQITIVSISRLADSTGMFQDSAKFFESIKEQLLKPPAIRLVSEQSITIDGFEARDYSVEDQIGFTKTRVIFTRERIFEITQNAANWSAQGEAKQKAFDDETQRFYNSFKINTPFDLALIAGGITPESVERRRSVGTIASEIGDADEEGWREYRFDRAGAAVSFPVGPTKETKPFESGLINATMTSYTSVRDQQTFLFADVNLGIQTNDVDFRNGLYDGWQSGLKKAFLRARIKQTDIEFNGMPARKILGENEAVRFEAVSLFAGGRLYQLMVVTNKNGENSENIGESAASNGKFLDSFKTFPATIGADENSGDTQKTISVDNQKFVNDEFRFSLDLPKGWTRIDTVDLSESVERMIETDPSLNRTGKTILTQSAGRTKMLFRLFKPQSDLNQSASFICLVETIQSKGFDMKAIAEVSEENFVSNMGYEVYSPLKIVNINGAIVYRIWLRKHINKFELKQALYMTKTNEKIIQFAISYIDEKDLETMERSLNTLRFEQLKK